MDPKDLQRYKRLLLAKLEELSATRTEAESPVVAAGALEEDLIDQANADAEAELPVRLHQSDARLRQAPSGIILSTYKVAGPLKTG